MNSHSSHFRSYLATFAALLVLLVVTVGAAFLELGAWAPVVAMSIATAKAVLIVTYFMHLNQSDHLTRTVAVAGAFWLLICLVFTMSDYLTRYGVERFGIGGS